MTVTPTELAAAARRAANVVATLETKAKNDLLLALADRVDAAHAEILAANEADLEAARADGLAAPKLARLALSESNLEQLAAGIRQVAALPDPVGAVTEERTVDSGLRVRRVRTPLGVVCMIYEARPAVTLDAFALCFKSGNACILKGGKEARCSNSALAAIAHAALRDAGLPEAAATIVAAIERDGLVELLSCRESIDVVIPRGGAELIRFVAERSRIPTIQHFHGVCHIYCDATCEHAVARRLCVSAKCSAPATCNALECVLVDAVIASTLVPALVADFEAAGVEVHGDDVVRRLAGERTNLRAAVDDDWGREFLDLVVAMRVVDGIEEAIAHIEQYGSGHTDAILTGDEERAREFCRRVRSSCVLVNASTRFNDGFQLGLGAEIGISTTPMHAYGPMGLNELTVTRFVVEGDGHTR